MGVAPPHRRRRRSHQGAGSAERRGPWGDAPGPVYARRWGLDPSAPPLRMIASQVLHNTFVRSSSLDCFERVPCVKNRSRSIENPRIRREEHHGTVSRSGIRCSHDARPGREYDAGRPSHARDKASSRRPGRACGNDSGPARSGHGIRAVGRVNAGVIFPRTGTSAPCRPAHAKASGLVTTSGPIDGHHPTFVACAVSGTRESPSYRRDTKWYCLVAQHSSAVRRPGGDTRPGYGRSASSGTNTDGTGSAEPRGGRGTPRQSWRRQGRGR